MHTNNLRTVKSLTRSRFFSITLPAGRRQTVGSSKKETRCKHKKTAPQFADREAVQGRPMPAASLIRDRYQSLCSEASIPAR